MATLELPGLLPPQALDAERAVLGGALLDAETAALVAALEPAVFYADKHRAVATAIRRLVGRGEAVDMLTTRAELEALGAWPEMPPASLELLVETAATATLVDQYVALVRERATRRAMIRLGRDLLDAGFDETQEAAPALAQHMAACLQLEQGAVVDPILTPAVYAAEYTTTEDAPAILSGLPILDAFAGGIRSSNMTIIAGRPATGKTTLATQIAHQVALVGRRPTFMLSLDMPRAEIADRLLAQAASTRLPARRTAWAPATLGPALERLAQSGFHIADPTAPTLDQVQAMIRRAVAKYGCQLVILDHVDNVVGPRSPSKHVEVSAVAKGLRATTRQLGLPLLLLCQLNREPEKREVPRPKLSDLRESGTLEQEAAAVLFVWSRVDPEKSADPQEVSLFLAKNRWGEIGERKYLFQRSMGRFREAA